MVFTHQKPCIPKLNNQIGAVCAEMSAVTERRNSEGKITLLQQVSDKGPLRLAYRIICFESRALILIHAWIQPHLKPPPMYRRRQVSVGYHECTNDELPAFLNRFVKVKIGHSA